MTIPSTQINYPFTTLHLSDESYTVDINGSGITTRSITPAILVDTVASSGTANQVLTASGAGGSVLWADLPVVVTPSLAEVMAVATAGDAGGQALHNTPSIGLFNTNVGVVLSAVHSTDVLNISTALDTTGAPKEFSRAYLPISVGGVVYYLPLYSMPV